MTDKELVLGFVGICIAAVIYMMFLPTIPHKAPPITGYGYMMKWMNHDD